MVIGGKQIGLEKPCFIIAEAGVNHNGSMELAHALIDAACDAGADAVKFQTFSTDDLASPEAATAEYQQAGGRGPATQRELLRALELDLEEFGILIEYCARRKITFLSTPFDEKSATALVAMGMQAVKVPSGEITNVRLLRHVADLDVPLIVSTGMSTLAEVAEAMRVLREAAPTGDVVLLHCVSCYPAEPDETNLRAMATMAQEFGVPVGLSDHTLGQDVAVAAAALGAVVLEKHLTLDRSMPGPDHAASLEPGDFGRLVQSVRIVESALGDGRKRPVARERETASVSRRSIAAARDLVEGDRIANSDLVLMRPGTGLAPSMESHLIGRRLNASLRAGALLTMEDVE